MSSASASNSLEADAVGIVERDVQYRRFPCSHVVEYLKNVETVNLNNAILSDKTSLALRSLIGVEDLYNIESIRHRDFCCVDRLLCGVVVVVVVVFACYRGDVVNAPWLTRYSDSD